MMDGVTREAATRAAATRSGADRSYEASPPPKRRRPLRTFLVVTSSVLVGVAVVTLAVGLDQLDQGKPRIEIPEGIPPGPGAPTPPIDINAPGRTAGRLDGWATPLSETLAISPTALEAYGYAAAVMTATRPECGIGWTTLAGIAAVESKHGTHGGSSVGDDGKVSPSIRGIPLDGSPGVAEIPDTDGGAMDGDATHDRAMGPLQFIPETWQRWGVDANGDGVVDPDSIDDAALTAARYLCARGGDLTTAEGWTAALMAYNLSGEYLRDVRDRAAAYSVGVRR
ncbi:transglycosylase protein with SLT domain [Rhodococcus sp. OK519]|uniref:lytic transglycosylase domain-containing protein n=1 Tax=Rhodococcus sp. OK519 TaxID=2135729 RepID=UPI000D48C59D|nr:transglycosylase protein with SLT domain [Rhodococcus sp. OK519]